MTYISKPHRGTIYCVEPARRGSRKLVASAMPEKAIECRACGGSTFCGTCWECSGTGERLYGDERIPLRKVPLAIRREARAAMSHQITTRAVPEPRPSHV